SEIAEQPPRSRPETPPGPRAPRAARATTSFRPAGMPCRTPSAAPHAPPSGPLELRRPLLDARHLRLDDVLAGPCPFEELLVLGPLILVGAVVVEHSLRVLQREWREARDLCCPRLRVGQRADAVGHPGLQRNIGGEGFRGEQHAPRPAGP